MLQEESSPESSSAEDDDDDKVDANNGKCMHYWEQTKISVCIAVYLATYACVLNPSSCVFLLSLLNQAHAGLWPMRIWFLEITLVWMSVCMCVCLCVCPLGYENPLT